MKTFATLLALALLLNCSCTSAQNATLTENLVNALFQFVEANHEDMSEDIVSQLEEVQQGLEQQVEQANHLEDELDGLFLTAGVDLCEGVRFDGHCYVLHNQKYNIHMANITCTSMDMNLAEIFSEEEYTAVMEYIQSTDIMTDRAVVYVWTGMDLEGFPQLPEGQGQGGQGGGPPGPRHEDHEHYHLAWLPSFPREVPNYEYISWQILSDPNFGDHGFLNVPDEATGYPLCQYDVEHEEHGSGEESGEGSGI